MGQVSSRKRTPVYPFNQNSAQWNGGFIPPGSAVYPNPAMQMPVPTNRKRSKRTMHNQATPLPLGFVPYANQVTPRQGPPVIPGIPMQTPTQASHHPAMTPLIFAAAAPTATPAPVNRRAPTPFIRAQNTPIPNTPAPQAQFAYAPAAVPQPQPQPVIPQMTGSQQQQQPAYASAPFPAQSTQPIIPPTSRPPSAAAAQPPPAPESDVFRRTRPPTPPNSSVVYGPPHVSAGLLSNPLPPPPRDLYEFSPYKNLLDLPQTTALLAERRKRAEAGGGGAVNVGPDIMQPGSAIGTFTVSRAGTKKKGGGGLFRSLSSRKKEKDKEPETRYIYMHVPGNIPPANGADPATLSRMSSVHSAVPSFGHAMPNPASTPAPPPPVGSPELHPSKIYFSHLTALAPFLNHSRHRILYGNKIYPTATHLHEALKYLPHRPELAEILRNTDDVQDVYRLSEQWENEYGLGGAGVRRDWRDVFLSMMEEVLYLKFKQHPDIRRMLMATGDAEIVYSDGQDSYWGDGVGLHGRELEDTEAGRLGHLVGAGLNELGKALVRVRTKLRTEGS